MYSSRSALSFSCLWRIEGLATRARSNVPGMLPVRRCRRAAHGVCPRGIPEGIAEGLSEQYRPNGMSVLVIVRLLLHGLYVVGDVRLELTTSAL